jgi:hypothetical protein
MSAADDYRDLAPGTFAGRSRQPAVAARPALMKTAVSLTVSLALHGLAAAILAGMVYSVTAVTTRSTPTSDVLLTLRPGPGESFHAAQQPLGPTLEHILKTAPKSTTVRGGSGESAQQPTVSLQDLLNQTSSAGQSAAGSGSPGIGQLASAITGSTGVGSALDNLPSGDGIMFAGLTATGELARSVVYVVDTSGPMLSSLPEVFAELVRSVDRLLPTQKFGVVLFRDDGGPTSLMFDRQLREATGRSKTELRAWLSKVQAGGKSNPLDGMRSGLAMKPQVIFLLSRSIPRTGGGFWDVGAEATLKELDQLNPVLVPADPSTNQPAKRGTVIKTIQFLEPDPTGTMETIAKLHGGSSLDGPAHRVLTRQELRR